MNLIKGFIVLNGHTVHKSEVVTAFGGYTHIQTCSLAVTVVPFPEGLCM